MKPPAAAYDGQFSPDGRWVAYTSRESGTEEVYVMAFDATRVLSSEPGPAESTGSGKWLISTGGGRCPRWRSDGKEVFYLSPSNQMLVAAVEETAGALEVGRAHVLFRSSAVNSLAPFDVSADGMKFVITSLSSGPSPPLTLIVNWTATLQRQ